MCRLVVIMQMMIDDAEDAGEVDDCSKVTKDR